MRNNKVKFEYLAGDYNSPFIRNYIFVNSFFDYPKLLGIPRFDIGIYCVGKKIDYVANMQSWSKCHKKLAKKIAIDNLYVDKLIDRIVNYGSKFNDWSEKNIYLSDLKQRSAKKLLILYKEFVKRQGVLYGLGVALPILDFQNLSFVEGNLEKYLHSKLEDNDYREYYRVFTEPTYPSFAQEQEIDLLRLMSKYYKSKNWTKDLINLSPAIVKEKWPDFYRLLERHTHKYCWVYYVYVGPAYNESNFIDFIKDYLFKKIDPMVKLNDIKNHNIKIKKLKKRYINNLKPDKFNLMILNLAGKMVWAKPRRKDFQSKSYYHFEKLQKEIGRRLNLSLNQVRSAPLNILEDCLLGKVVDLDVVNKISNIHLCYPTSTRQVKVLYGEEALNFKNNRVKKIKIEVANKLLKLRGVSAFSGLVRGHVKIINYSEQISKMKYGDVLVSMATSPSLVSAMKKAAAIITDEGGLTCHASIVSRELQIPCVVGTKFATKILKDGDLVEVDASNGIIKKIN